jgi:uncharacterized Fe-S center protein
MNEVLFADARVRELTPDQTLPAKFRRMLEKLDLPSTVKGRTVAVKMHLGGNLGFTTIHPLFVRILVEELKKASAAKVLVMDGSIEGAPARGYTYETIGAPIVSCFGQTGKYLYKKRIGFHSLKWAYYGGNAWDADVFIDLSHVKGHGMCGFGGAIKNIAMGCVPPQTRSDIHRLQGGIIWHANRCIHCQKCIRECPRHANRFTDKGEYVVDWHECTYCQHCVLVCPKKALTSSAEHFTRFQEGLARVAAVFLKHFKPDRVLFINFLLDITIFCDCWGLSTPALVPDVGILAGRNIVAVETASLDKIKFSKLMKEGLPEGRKIVLKRGHMFERIHGKDPYTQVRKMAELGFGPAHYKLVTIQ